MTHFIAMGGEHGCLPDNCASYRNLEDAISGLDNIYELSDKQKKELLLYSSTKLDREQGGAYCEVSDCDCDSPWEHEEMGSQDDWPEYTEEEEEE